MARKVRFPSWRLIAEVIGVTAIVASLLFVGFQLRQDAQIARADVFSAFASTTIEMNQAHYAYADLIAKANRDETLTDAEEYVLEEIVNNLFLNVRFLNIRAQRLGEIGSSTNELIFSAHLFQNPGLRAAWMRHDAKWRAHVDPMRTASSLAQTYESGSGAMRERIHSNLIKLDEMHSQQ